MMNITARYMHLDKLGREKGVLFNKKIDFENGSDNEEWGAG